MSKTISPMQVLVVDDDRSICEYMETFLSKDGIRVYNVIGTGEGCG